MRSEEKKFKKISIIYLLVRVCYHKHIFDSLALLRNTPKMFLKLQKWPKKCFCNGKHLENAETTSSSCFRASLEVAIEAD